MKITVESSPNAPQQPVREEKKKVKTSNSLKFLTNFRLSGIGWGGMRWDGMRWWWRTDGRFEEEGSRPPILGGLPGGVTGSAVEGVRFIYGLL